MPEINHKQSTMMDAIFTSNCLCELILDGTHIKDAMVEWLMPLLEVNASWQLVEVDVMQDGNIQMV